jgi:hypothetical protein
MLNDRRRCTNRAQENGFCNRHVCQIKFKEKLAEKWKNEAAAEEKAVENPKISKRKSTHEHHEAAPDTKKAKKEDPGSAEEKSLRARLFQYASFPFRTGLSAVVETEEQKEDFKLRRWKRLNAKGDKKYKDKEKLFWGLETKNKVQDFLVQLEVEERMKKEEAQKEREEMAGGAEEKGGHGKHLIQERVLRNHRVPERRQLPRRKIQLGRGVQRPKKKC